MFNCSVRNRNVHATGEQVNMQHGQIQKSDRQATTTTGGNKVTAES